MPDKPAPLSVHALTVRIRQTLEAGFRGVWVEGELSNVRIQASGHAYFTLKDAKAQLPAAIFAPALRGVPFRLADGLKVRALGDVSVYEPRGTYQLIVRQLEQVGAGDLMAQFEERKRRLAAEGLFAPERKRPLPLLPRTVGIVTSPTGAAIRDILNVTRRRFPNLRILLAPARVQGEGAAREIADAIALLNGLPAAVRPDVLIVGRGGGSVEDLWCFNEEEVARAVVASGIPVISAVGHEIDFTICDFAADLRAPTPSAAAELVVGRKDDFLTRLAALRATLARDLRHAVVTRRGRLERARSHHVFRQPGSVARQHAQRLDLLDARLRNGLTAACRAARHRLDTRLPRLRLRLAWRLADTARRAAEARSRIETACALRRAAAAQRVAGLRRHLQALSPLAVLERGYSVVRGPDGHALRSPESLRAGDLVAAQLAHGAFRAAVIETLPDAPAAPAPPPAPLSAPLAAPPPLRRHARAAADAHQMTFF